MHKTTSIPGRAPPCAHRATPRVLFIHNDYGSPSGEEHAVEILTGLLREQGHDVFQLRKSSAGLRDSRWGQVRAFWAGMHSPQAVRDVDAFLDRHPVDLVQVQNLFPFWSASVLKAIRRRGIPLVMRCPNYRLFCPNGLHWSRGQLCERCVNGSTLSCATRNCAESFPKSVGYALRTAVAKPVILDCVDLFLVLSEFQKQKFISRGVPAERLAVISNPPQADDLLEPPQLGTQIAFVGRASSEKGLEQFLKLARRLPDLPFAVAGGDRAACELAGRVPENVHCAGYLTGEQLNDFYRASRILVVPSRCFEGFPNALLKAMAYSKPVVASRIGAIPEIVRDRETGLLCDPDAISQSAALVRDLYHSPERCRAMGKRGRLRVQRRFSREHCYRTLLNAYRQAGVQVAVPAAKSLPVSLSGPLCEQPVYTS